MKPQYACTVGVMAKSNVSTGHRCISACPSCMSYDISGVSRKMSLQGMTMTSSGHADHNHHATHPAHTWCMLSFITILMAHHVWEADSHDIAGFCSLVRSSAAEPTQQKTPHSISHVGYVSSLCKPAYCCNNLAYFYLVSDLVALLHYEVLYSAVCYIPYSY